MECPVEVLIQRDVKGLYKKALAGEIEHFTGISDPYESPPSPELTIHSARNPDRASEGIWQTTQELRVDHSMIDDPYDRSALAHHRVGWDLFAGAVGGGGGARRGPNILGITDHDTFSGYDQALPLARRAGLELVCGIELSTKLHGHSVHLLGYFLKHDGIDVFRTWIGDLASIAPRACLRLVARLRELGLDITLERGARRRNDGTAALRPAAG